MTRIQKLKFIENTKLLLDGFRVLDRYDCYDEDVEYYILNTEDRNTWKNYLQAKSWFLDSHESDFMLKELGVTSMEYYDLCYNLFRYSLKFDIKDFK